MSHAQELLPAGNTTIAPTSTLNSTEHTPEGTIIPGVLFAIPFPPTINTAPSSDRPSFLLYAPPRAGYVAPPKSPDGTPPKQNLSYTKKLEAKWQGEVAQGQAIHDGKVTDAGKWAKIKGGVTRTAQKVIQYMPSSDIEALSRVPPGKKMHEAIIFTPGDASERGQAEVNEAIAAHSSSRAEADLDAQLKATKKKAVKKTAISGVLLPITGAFDWICPILLVTPEHSPRNRRLMTRWLCTSTFEVDVAYFSAQLQGLRKATALTGNDVHLSLQPSPYLAAVTEHLHALCFKLSPSHFNIAAPGTIYVNPRFAEGIIQQFREAVSPEVAARHVLDPAIITDDLERCLNKGAKEFVKTL
ncbi:hypothetical protein P7C70_g4130, partial [Phenoliferia sp. Uapishka_3]